MREEARVAKMRDAVFARGKQWGPMFGFFIGPFLVWVFSSSFRVALVAAAVLYVVYLLAYHFGVLAVDLVAFEKTGDIREVIPFAWWYFKTIDLVHTTAWRLEQLKQRIVPKDDAERVARVRAFALAKGGHWLAWPVAIFFVFASEVVLVWLARSLWATLIILPSLPAAFLVFRFFDIYDLARQLEEKGEDGCCPYPAWYYFKLFG